MCGITGFWARTAPSDHIGASMAQRIESRGPDDMGTWTDCSSDLALAHRRLSIVDLSPAGHQPMHSPCGRYVLVYNGEIYNHSDLRAELDKEGGGFNWRGHSDTETLLAALRHWGLQGALERVNGMFAFALWDTSEQTLFLARDRMGEKPLYYGHQGDTFFFGSELKALTAHPAWRGEVDHESLALYMRYKYVPSPWSIYKGIRKLPPATFVAITDYGRSIQEPRCYWSLRDVANRGLCGSNDEPEQLLEKLDSLLSDSVYRRMAADVPLGAFLSGGYDSTTVAAVMQAQSKRPIKTFSVGFEEAAYNEATYARQVARHLGTDHTELVVTANDALGVIPKLPAIYDEPFGGSSQIPTFLVSQLARESVKVSLSGDGGDELFGGYNRHVVGPEVWEKVSKLPRPVRRALAAMVRGLPGDQSLLKWLPRRAHLPQLRLKLAKLANALEMESGTDFYRDLVSLWKAPEQVVLGASEPDTLLNRREEWPNSPGLRDLMLFWDTKTYLADEILTKLDRASMAVGLEARVPLLDHRLVEFSWQVPMAYKVHKGQGKWLLRQLTHRYVPQELMERPKQGFGIPIEHWLRGPLREWAESLLDEQKLRDQGFFDPKPIRQAWNDHINGRGKRQYELWAVLMFQAWLESS